MAVDIALTASAVDATDQTTYTFANQAIGVATTDRDVVVAAMWSAAGDVTLGSATIADNGATIDIQTNVAGDSRPGLALIRARVPSGTLATIVLNLSGAGANRASIDVYRMTGARVLTADTDSASGTSSPQSISLDIPAEGGAIATAGAVGSTTGTFSWTGLTEDSDDAVENANNQHSSASGEFATVQAALAVQAAVSGDASTGFAVAGVSFESAIEEGVGSAAGTSTATATAVALSFAAAAASGAATVSGVGAGLTETVASASGTATVSGVGFGGLRPAVGSAAGQASVTGIASLLHITNTVGIQKPVDYALAWREEASSAATPGDAKGMSKALLKSIFRE